MRAQHEGTLYWMFTWSDPKVQSSLAAESRGGLRGVKTCHIQAPTVKCHKTINRSGTEGPELTQIPVQKECYERTKEVVKQ